MADLAIKQEVKNPRVFITGSPARWLGNTFGIKRQLMHSTSLLKIHLEPNPNWYVQEKNL